MNSFATHDWVAKEFARLVMNYIGPRDRELVGTKDQPEMLPNTTRASLSLPVGWEGMDPYELTELMKLPAKGMAQDLQSARQIAVLPMPDLGCGWASRVTDPDGAFSLVLKSRDYRECEMEVGYA